MVPDFQTYGTKTYLSFLKFSKQFTSFYYQVMTSQSVLRSVLHARHLQSVQLARHQKYVQLLLLGHVQSALLAQRVQNVTVVVQAARVVAPHVPNVIVVVPNVTAAAVIRQVSKRFYLTTFCNVNLTLL